MEDFELLKFVSRNGISFLIRTGLRVSDSFLPRPVCVLVQYESLELLFDVVSYFCYARLA